MLRYAKHPKLKGLRLLIHDRPDPEFAVSPEHVRGIALLERIDSDDPTALEGLPLMRTCALLRLAGIDPLADPA